MSDLRSCGFIVLRREPTLSFLLMKHPKRWDLPKGHVDPGETDMQCALRELVEETAIREEDLDIESDFRFELSYKVRYKRTGGTEQDKTLVIFLGWLKRDVDIVLTEHKGYEWFDWSPPHKIQEKTIDPLLESVSAFLAAE